MTQSKTRKARVRFSPEQKLEYAKLMVVEGFSIKQIMDVSGAGATAAGRGKKQYEEELKGQTLRYPHIKAIKNKTLDVKIFGSSAKSVGTYWFR